MIPSDLKAESFAAWSPGARALAVRYLSLLRTMPLSLLPSYLLQIESDDRLFPAEQKQLASQLAALSAKPELMSSFAAIAVPQQAARIDWLAHPGLFIDEMSRGLWQTHQIDAYHRAAEELFAAMPLPPVASQAPAPLLIAFLGRDAAPSDYPLFVKLRHSGTYLRHVDETQASTYLMGLLHQRATAHPEAYAHWYVDGGEPWPFPPSPSRSPDSLKCFTYPELTPLTDAVLQTMKKAVQDGWGPELLADRMRELKPASLDAGTVTADPRMAHLFVTLLTQGSGTQLYSTSFMEAAGVEVIRRAQPSTVMLRFAPRRKPASMNDMLDQRGQSLQTDPEGSLIDADMALYYAWLAMRKLPGGEQASLLALVEGQGQAFVAGPAVTHGIESSSSVTIPEMLAMIHA
jgi:hypothetical protein